MSENAMRAESAPLNLATLPRPSRSLFKRLIAYPSWLAEGWANPSDEHLRAAAEYRDTRPIQRARKVLVTLGLIEHRQIRRGEFLPNGERARFRHWIYVAGPGLRRPPPQGGGGEALPDRYQKGTDAVPERPPVGAFLVPRSVDLERSELVRSSPNPPPVLITEEQTSLRSLGSTEIPSDAPPVRAPEIATGLLASEVARYFVAATGLGWKTIRNDILEYLAPFIDGMNGDPASKVARACRVIDAAVLEAGKPSLRYVFHREMFWKRLEALTDPQAKPLARAQARPLDAPTAESPPEVAPAYSRSAKPQPGARMDGETLRIALAKLEAIGMTDAPLARLEPSAATKPSERAEFDELYRADNEARARRGLPPRYPPLAA